MKITFQRKACRAKKPLPTMQMFEKPSIVVQNVNSKTLLEVQFSYPVLNTGGASDTKKMGPCLVMTPGWVNCWIPIFLGKTKHKNYFICKYMIVYAYTVHLGCVLLAHWQDASDQQNVYTFRFPGFRTKPSFTTGILLSVTWWLRVP